MNVYTVLDCNKSVVAPPPPLDTSNSLFSSRSCLRFLFFQLTFAEPEVISLVSEEETEVEEIQRKAKGRRKAATASGRGRREREVVKEGKYEDFGLTHSLVYTFGVW